MGSCDTKCNLKNNSHTKLHNQHSHNHSHSHSHSHKHEHDKKTNCCHCSDVMRLIFMIAMIFSFFLIEITVGYISKSIALINDSFHMLSDSLALFVALGAAIISRRHKPDLKRRTEVLGSLINSVFLIALCFSILIEAIERLVDPKKIEKIELMLYVGIIGLIINLVGLLFLGHSHVHTHSHSHSHEAKSNQEDEEDGVFLDQMKSVVSHSARSDFIMTAKEINSLKERAHQDTADQTLLDSTSSVIKKKTGCNILSKEANMNMKAAFLHVFADAIGSVIVIISGLINRYDKALKVPESIIDLIDPILSLCLVTLILCSAIPLAKESSLILLKIEKKETCADKKGSVKSSTEERSVSFNLKNNKKSFPERRHSIF